MVLIIAVVVAFILLIIIIIIIIIIVIVIIRRRRREEPASEPQTKETPVAEKKETLFPEYMTKPIPFGKFHERRAALAKDTNLEYNMEFDVCLQLLLVGLLTIKTKQWVTCSLLFLWRLHM